VRAIKASTLLLSQESKIADGDAINFDLTKRMGYNSRWSVFIGTGPFSDPALRPRACWCRASVAGLYHEIRHGLRSATPNSYGAVCYCGVSH
jgi:hypothetical protein